MRRLWLSHLSSNDDTYKTEVSRFKCLVGFSMVTDIAVKVHIVQKSTDEAFLPSKDFVIRDNKIEHVCENPVE